MASADTGSNAKSVSITKVITAQPASPPARIATAPAAAPRIAERRAKLARIVPRVAPMRLEDRRLVGPRPLSRRRRADQDDDARDQRGQRAVGHGGRDAGQHLRSPGRWRRGRGSR